MYYFPVSALLIEYLILTIVDSRDSYGYEISQTIKLVADIKESTLYPILKRLEKAGSIRRRRYCLTCLKSYRFILQCDKCVIVRENEMMFLFLPCCEIRKFHQ